MKEPQFNYNLIYKKPNYFMQFLSNALLTFFCIISLFFIAFSYIYTSTPVTGISMQPTLNEKGRDKSDIVYINRLAKYSHGDIIVTINPTDRSEYIIKRVIGLQGDVINIVKHSDSEYSLVVNGETLFEPYTMDHQNGTTKGIARSYDRFHSLRVNSQVNRPGLFNENGELVVPEGEIFLMGDNRYDSEDSTTHGPLKASEVKGKVDYIVYYGQSEFVFFVNTFTPFSLEQN